MDEKYIPIKTKKETAKINLNDIIYIEKELKKINIFTEGRTISLYGKMDQVKQYLDKRFLSCHRSYIFNMDKIVCMTGQALYMNNNKSIHLGRESFRKARRTFAEYLKTK